jgi:4'-phosphopantetheinyl transferase EntD
MIATLPSALAVGDTRIVCAAADRPAAIEELAPDERARALALPDRRRHDYLLGRAALRRALGPGRDTSAIAMPHRRLSLTHGGGIAVAAMSASDHALGVGIDWEAQRTMNPAAARFFLTDREAAATAGEEATLLRLWTVKEALFKATPDNAGLSLRMFEVAEPAADCGAAWLSRRCALALRYATWRGGGGFLSAALSFASNDVPATARTTP